MASEILLSRSENSAMKMDDLYKIETQDEKNLTWRLVGHNPTIWRLGVMEGDESTEVAEITRGDGGWWNWALTEPARIGSGIYRISGRETSQGKAMIEVQKLVKVDYYLGQRLAAANRLWHFSGLRRFWMQSVWAGHAVYLGYTGERRKGRVKGG